MTGFHHPSRPLSLRAKPPVQRVEIDVENENPVKQINKVGEISRPAAEEGHRVALISDPGFDFVYIPNVCCATNRMRTRIASPEMFPEAEMLPHLICSRPIFIGGANDEADQHGGA